MNKRLQKLMESAEDVRIFEIPQGDLAGSHRGEELKKSLERAFIVRVKPRIKSEQDPTLPSPKKPNDPQNGDDPESLLHSAELLLANREYIYARNIFSFVLRKDKSNFRALKGLGICLYRLGEKAQAKKCFNALWELHKQEDSLVWLSQCFSEEGDEEQAQTFLSQVKKSDSLSPNEQFEYFKIQGNAFTRESNYDKAREFYEKARTLQPKSDVIEVNLGTVHFQLGKFSKAKEHFQTALQLNNKNPKAYCGLGLLEMTQKQFLDAKKHFEAALEFEPDNMVALHQLILIGHLTNNFSHIKRQLKEAIRLCPKNIELQYGLAGIYFKEENLVESLKVLSHILKYNPTHERSVRLKEDIEATKRRTN